MRMLWSPKPQQPRKPPRKRVSCTTPTSDVLLANKGSRLLPLLASRLQSKAQIQYFREPEVQGGGE